ncbi:protein kinase C iota type-like [Rhinophrynus dorsalis]
MDNLLARFRKRVREALTSCFFQSSTKLQEIQRINGHGFEAQRMKMNAVCAHCRGMFWNLKRKGYSCMACGIVVHKRCRCFTTHCVKEAEEGNSKCPPQEDMPEIPSECQVKMEEVSIPSEALALIDLDEAEEESSECPPQDVLPEEPIECQAKIEEVIDPCEDLAPHELDTAEEESNECPPEDDLPGTSNQCQIEAREENEPSSVSSNEDFSIIHMLGQGGFGKVFLARNEKDQKNYALKAIKKEFICNYVELLRTEKRVLQKAVPCPFLVSMHSCFQTASHVFFVMNYAPGGNLGSRINWNGKLCEDHIRFYAAEICIGVHFLHQNGIIHRDLKPENILLDSEGHIQICDFGVCAEVTERQKIKEVCGTPEYCAPEMFESEGYSFSVDWWALGIIILSMADGELPYELEMSDMKKALKAPIQIPAFVSDELRWFLRGLLLKNPEIRLGCHPKLGFLQIKRHPFFHSLDWEMVANKCLQPPYKPQYKSPNEMRLNKEDCYSLYPSSSEVERAAQYVDQTLFDGFDCSPA